MHKYLLTTSTLGFINSSILGAVLLSSSIVKAENTAVQYSPTIELSTRNSKKRNITEIDYMQPVWGNDNFLSLVDLKLKVDNSKSKEVNLGFAIRYNFDDRVVLGFYNYFDHRRTGNNFIVNGWTTGVEALSKYVDARVNFYVPENKKKKITHNYKKRAELQGTRLYAVSGGHEYEYALKGYDIEIGGPIFGFSDNLNEKFGTKIFVAKYDFRNKNTKSITGTRFRLQQSLGSMQLGNNSLDFTLNAETQYDKIRKRQNFVGLGAKLTFDNNTKNKKNPNSLKSRMTETIVRDVDIVTESDNAKPQISNFVTKDGREIKNMYYVGGAGSNYSGDGTKDNPYSLEQLKQMNLDDALVVITSIDQTKGGKALSITNYEELNSLPQVVNGKDEVKLIATGEGIVDVAIKTNSNGALSMETSDVVNTSVVFNTHNINSAPINPSNSTMVNNAILLEAPVATVVNPEQAQILQAQAQAAAAQAQILQAQAQAAAIEAQAAATIVANFIQADQLDEAQRVAREQMLATLVAGEVDSGVDRAALTPVEQTIYDLILEIKNLRTVDPLNIYNIRENEYTGVEDMVAEDRQNNPGGTEPNRVNRVQAAIDLLPGITQGDKTRLKHYVKGLSNEGRVDADGGNGGQQGIGVSHRNPSDITGVDSLNRLKKIYGIVDGDATLDLVSRMALSAIKANVTVAAGLANNQLEALALGAANRSPSQAYKTEANKYAYNNNPDMDIINNEVEKANTAVNKHMAAYRALQRITFDIDDVYNEEVTGRFNVREALAYTLQAITDIDEVQNTLRISITDRPITPADIFKSQQQNINGLLTNLGNTQRAYNKESGVPAVRDRDGVVDYGGVLDQAGFEISQVGDRTSCAHGVFARIVDTNIDNHRAVEIKHNSPASFADEFQKDLKKKVKALPVALKNQVIAFHNDLNVNMVIGIDQVTRKATFETGVGEPEFPAFYKAILSEVTSDLTKRYDVFHSDYRFKLIKPDDGTAQAALAIFRTLEYVNYGL